MKRFALLFFFLLSSMLQMATAQTNSNFKIKVVDNTGKPIGGVVVMVDGNQSTPSNNLGQAAVDLDTPVEVPSEVVATKRGFEQQDWGMIQQRQIIQILMWPAAVVLKGEVRSLNGQPVQNVTVKMAGNEFVTRSGKRGDFSIEIKGSDEINSRTRFIVGDELVTNENFRYDPATDYVTITVESLSGSVASTSSTKPSTATTSQPTQTRPVVEGSTDRESLADLQKEFGGLKPVLVVVVYDEDISPADGVRVKVDSVYYITDERGEFQVMTDSVDDSMFQVDNYTITKRTYEYNDNYLFIHIQDTAQAREKSEKELELEYDENFRAVFNQLESEKQLLQENGQELRKEIAKINEKLGKGIDSNQRASLEAYLGRLENALIENELAYEEAQYRTNVLLDKMRGEILQGEVRIEEIAQEKEATEREKLLLAIVAIISLVLMVVFVVSARKTRQQRNKLAKQNKELEEAKEKIRISSEQMESVRDVGQVFTSNLDFWEHTETIYESLNNIFDVDVFGLGMLDKDANAVVFQGMIVRGEVQPEFRESLSSDTPTAYCMNTNLEVISNDFHQDYKNYIETSPQPTDPRSMVVLPLIVQQECVGVISLQSDKPNVYGEHDMSVFRTLASYAAIAVSNANSYQIIKRKNDSITDSIRYAQTIQQAILPTKESLDKAFKDWFVIFRPKDIVSGDFYWFTKVELPNGEQKAFLAVVDCTGHGVPGAFMSIIGNTLLNEIIIQKEVYDTVEIMNLLNSGVKSALKQEQRINDDGMDVCLCEFSMEGDKIKEISFTGAKRPLYLGKKGTKKIENIAGDIKSVGSIFKSKREFTKKVISVTEGDIIYLTTDGFVDQNNQERNKIGTLRMLSLLRNNIDKSIEEQEKLLTVELDSHQEGVEQRDDITIVGIRI